MAIRRDELAIGLYDAGERGLVLSSATSTLAIRVQLRGEPVTAATCVCTVTRGSTSITPTVTIASGVCSAPVTTANLTTLGASVFDLLTVRWSGTVADGSESHAFVFEVPVIVSDRDWRMPVDYDRLKRALPWLNMSAAVPVNQSNWWPQCADALENLRVELERKTPQARDFLIGNPAQLRQLAELKCVEAILERAGGQDQGQALDTQVRLARVQEQIKQFWADIKVDVRTGTGSSDLQRVTLSQVRMVSGLGGGGIGGAL